MSIILIGMPGAGKSTLGRMLAAHLALPFFDTDHLIEQQTGRTLQQNLDSLGYLAMRELEGKVINEFPWPASPLVIATGGSAVYSTAAMQRLRGLGLCVYLQTSLEAIQVRVQNWGSRGFLAAPGQNLESIFGERHLLYRQFSDVILDCDDLDESQCLQRLLAIYRQQRPPE